MNNIQVQLEDGSYIGFTNTNISRSFLDIAGRFQLSIGLSKESSSYPIKIGDRINILIQSKVFLTGFVEGYRINQNSSNLNITFYGRDITCDIVDSTISFALAQGFTGAITLQKIYQTVLEKSGIDSKVLLGDNITDDDMFFQEGQSLIAKEGESIARYFQRAAEIKGLFVTTDGLGNIVITRGGNANKQIATKLLLQLGGKNNNIISSEASVDYSKRYYDYRLFSQPILNRFSKSVVPDNNDLYNGIMEGGTVTDDAIRKSRTLTMDTNLPLDKNDTIQRAIWEQSLRVSKSFRYTCLVNGFTYNDTNIWQPNILVTLSDTYAGISGNFLVDSVSFYLNDNASHTTLTLVDKNAYLLQANLQKQQDQAQRVGDSYINRFT